MEKNEFKVKYIRLNEPCNLVIQRPDQQGNFKFNIGEVYFKEYENTFDIFFIIDEEVKLYLTAINMRKNVFVDTIKLHTNVLKSGHYEINENRIKKRIEGLIEIRLIDKLEADIYGTE